MTIVNLSSTLSPPITPIRTSVSIAAPSASTALSRASPRASTDQPWPYSDPCRDRSFSLARFLVLMTLVLCLIPGGVLFFIFLMGRPYGLQEGSVIVYTIFAIFYTFSTNRGLRSYRFTCPAVRTQVFRLLWRHPRLSRCTRRCQTAALAVRPNLPRRLVDHNQNRQQAELIGILVARRLRCTSSLFTIASGP